MAGIVPIQPIGVDAAASLAGGSLVPGIPATLAGAPTNSSAAISSFSDYMVNAMGKVNDLKVQAGQMDALLAADQVQNLHQVAIAHEKASLAFQLMLQIRNKVLEAYREIMRMPI